MAVFEYIAIDSKTNEKREGVIDSPNVDTAILSLQKRGFVIENITLEKKPFMDLQRSIPFLNKVKTKDLVILSQQMATLFESRVSALQVFKLVGSETENPILSEALEEVSDDIRGGMTISNALAKHPNVFSNFYVNMVKAGEESGQLDKVFRFLADYLDRTYAVVSKARNALIYPLFVITVFIAVMSLMFTVVVPQISKILIDSGVELPIYTKLIIAVSNFFVNWWGLLIVLVVGGGGALLYYSRTEDGKVILSQTRLKIPILGNLYRKLYLSRIADNMNTMLVSGIPMLRSVEITASVVDDAVYSGILEQAYEEVKGGSTLSRALSDYDEVPSIMVQMMKVGEETGELGNVLQTMANFYTREVENAVDTLVSLIEPVMIVMLAIGVGILLAGVLMPIYNLAAAF